MFSDAQKNHIKEVKERTLKMFESAFFQLNWPDEIRRMASRGILTGGAIPSIMHGDKPNDWDIYLEREDDIEYVRQFFLKPEHHKYISEMKHNYIHATVAGKYFTANAITLKNGIQFIILQNARLREAFDFIHCMPFIHISTKQMHISENQYRAIMDKQLILNPKGHAPRLDRIVKYTGRGYKMSPEVKIIYDANVAMSAAAQPPNPTPPPDITSLQQAVLDDIATEMAKDVDIKMKQALRDMYKDAYEQILKMQDDTDAEPLF